MLFPRRSFLRVAAGAAALTAGSRLVKAQAYPARPVRFVVGFVPGGPNDILARLIGEWLSDRLGHPFVIDNIPGASSNTATEVVVRAPPDGHTLLLIGPANAINASLFPNLSFDIRRDIAPVAGLTREALVLVVHPSLPAATVPELIAHAKANPGRVRLAMTSSGSSPHVSGKLFQLMTGVAVTEVPYDGGGPALRDLVAGRVDMMFEPMSASIGPIRAGSLRALAVTTAGRSEALPQVPTMGETRQGLRGERGDRHRCAAQYLAADHHHPQPRDQCRLRRSRDASAFRRHRRRRADMSRPPSSETFSPRKSRNGPRWSNPPA